MGRYNKNREIFDNNRRFLRFFLAWEFMALRIKSLSAGVNQKGMDSK